MRKLFIISLMFVIVFSFFINAQLLTESKEKIEVKIEQADKTLLLILTVPKGFYTYKKSEYANKLQIELKAGGKVFTVKPIYPAGVKKGKDTILKKQFTVTYKGVKQNFVGKKLTIKLNYQLCNDARGECLPPVEGIFNLKVTQSSSQVDTKKVTDKKVATVKSAKSTASDSSADEELSFGEKISKLMKDNMQKPIFAFLLAMLGGLLASLTPCVYPVIPITMGYFAKSGEGKSKGAKFKMALIYVAGMGIVYTILGVIAGLTGSVFGEISNNPIFQIFMGLMFVLLALSLFEVYEIKMPQAFNKLKGKTGGSGYGSALGMGIVTGLVASPCVGPVILFLLAGVFQAGQPLYGAVLMAGFSIGMGFLFLFLALFSQGASKLPKAGNWMVRIKIGLGVLVLGSAVYFLNLATAGLKLPASMNWVVLAVVLIVSAYFGVKKIQSLYGNSGKHSMFLIALLLLLLGFSIMTSNTEKLSWGSDLKVARAQSVKESKPIFVDLYANWCGICKEVEHELVKATSLQNYLKANYIVVKMNYDDHKKMLKEKYGVAGLPHLMILSPTGEVLWKKTGISDAERFVKSLPAVLKKHLK